MKQLRVGILDGMHGATGGAQLVVAFLAQTLSRQCSVELLHHRTTGSLESLRRNFGLSLEGVTERVLDRLPKYSKPDLRSMAREVTGEASQLSVGYDLFIYSGFRIPPFCRARHGLVYCHFPFEVKLSDQAKELGSEKQTGVGRYLRQLAHQPLWHYRFRGYDRVLANSAFTAGWIKQRWNVEAQVVFPPVTAKIEGRPKKNLIVSVGKFTGNVKHSKKQLEQVKAFREILGSSNADWTLRMLGFSDTADLGAYIEAVRESARGLAIEVVENASRADILKALAEAKVYWHTMGLDTDESKYPERAEHFGIATVEAMRAGCVPVVVASGGQREIVANRESGYLCSDLGQLVQATRSLMQDQNLLARMSMSAMRRSFEFAPERFCSQITAITNEIFPGAISASSTADRSIAAGIEENVRS